MSVLDNGKSQMVESMAGRSRREWACLAWASLALVVGLAAPADAGSAVSCGGFAMLGGAQINCSHVVAKAPAQFCTFSWALSASDGSLQAVQGSFLVPPGASNTTVYQGSGFNTALSNPIILCQGRRSR